MGWWSATVMGGDTPLDFQGDMLDQCGVDYNTFASMDYNLPNLRSEIESNLGKLVEYCESETGDYRNIAFQVLGVLILESGSTLSDEAKSKIEEAILDDEWANEGDEERQAHMASFHNQLLNYDGTPTEVKYEGLFEKMFGKK